MIEVSILKAYHCHTMNRERFEHLVSTAVESLPEELHARLENITVVVEDYPIPDQLSRTQLSPAPKT